MYFDKEKVEKFQGEWKDDIPGGGKGTYTTKEGDMISGYWVEGRIGINGSETPVYTKKESINSSNWEDLSNEMKEKLLMIDLSERIN